MAVKKFLKVFDLDNRIIEIPIDDLDQVTDEHCIRCGCRIVSYDGREERRRECPVCHFRPAEVEDSFLLSKEISINEEKISALIEQLNWHNRLRKVMKEQNNVKAKNRKNLPIEE